MKITLDRNCTIDLVLQSEYAPDIDAIVQDQKLKCFVVEMGASELRG